MTRARRSNAFRQVVQTERGRSVHLLKSDPQFGICPELLLSSDAACVRSGSRSVVRAVMAV
jgi:hypothetical protein